MTEGNPWTNYWATNRDLVYRELAKYPNEYIKNACVEGLSSACKDVGFWQNLWQVKFGTPAPKGDLSAIRKAFYEENFWREMKDVVSDINPKVTNEESSEDEELDRSSISIKKNRLRRHTINCPPCQFKS